MNKILVITQGAPGSGKSTFAEQFKYASVFSTDDFHTFNGVYKFDPKKAGEAHKWNQERVRQALLNNEPLVVVANTNTQAWEAKPYVEMGLACGYNIVFAKCEGRFENVHDVPEEKVKMMRDRIEPLSIEACLAASKPVYMSKKAKLCLNFLAGLSLVVIGSLLFLLVSAVNRAYVALTPETRHEHFVWAMSYAIIGHYVRDLAAFSEHLALKVYKYFAGKK